VIIRNRLGFTLIELLVVIVIIGLLAGIGIASFSGSIDRAKIAELQSHVDEISLAAKRYFLDTGSWPPNYRLTNTLNPFTTNPSVSGWSGPYIDPWSAAHPWEGHIGWAVYDADGDGDTDTAIVLDDDRPGTTSTDNGGIIPLDTMIAIDKTFDDGNLATGNVRGNGLGFGAAAGELVILVRL